MCGGTLKRESTDIVGTKITIHIPNQKSKQNRLPRKLEKCRIAQDILCRAKRFDRSTTLCNAREKHKVQCKRDKQDGASEVSEEVKYKKEKINDEK